ncbi:MAG TPA: hypothetical protein VLN74_02640 [Ilumatobacteraceae bacterium]|nr:hypothetical protein [Ilumatobacteraceae bacterium]
MADPELLDPLEAARRGLDLSVSDLWWRYFAVGGMYTELEIEAILFGALVPTDNDRDMIAVALNERFRELGGDHPMPYTDDDEEQSPEDGPLPVHPASGPSM